MTKRLQFWSGVRHFLSPPTRKLSSSASDKRRRDLPLHEQRRETYGRRTASLSGYEALNALHWQPFGLEAPLYEPRVVDERVCRANEAELQESAAPSGA